MPIRRELRPLYPRNWREISAEVRFVRAGGKCQRCGRPHGETLRVLPDGRWYDPQQRTWRDGRGRDARWPDLLAMTRACHSRIILAAAHLNHDPSNNRWRNLRGLCQRCHLLHDRRHHRRQRWITWRSRYAVADLFLGRYVELKLCHITLERPRTLTQSPNKGEALASRLRIAALLKNRGGDHPGPEASTAA
jgi:hypothetical protein